MSGQGNKGISNKRGGSAKQNYTAIKYGNNQGSIAFGQIHKQGDVTSSVMLETPDGEHQLSLDLDGQRTGWTCSTSPGNFQVECGSANEEAQDSAVINAKNGNIILLATNGKIRMQATDIELIAVGEGGAKGNIKMNATETITTESKKFLVTAKSFYRIASPQTGEVVANGVLKLYSSIIRGVSDAVAVKDSKVAGQRFQKQMNEGT
tara:strand:+ start:265 stop:885 length:621 start_codon:yes stop_codon:yes gene_type:complete